MRSTRPRADRHRLQSGQSLVEAVVASLVVGIAVVAGLATLDASVIGARQVAVQAWAECMQRGTVEAVQAAPWTASGAYTAPAHVTVTAVSVGPGAQRVTVTIANPNTGTGIARVPEVHFFKAAVLSPSAGGYDPAAIAAGCEPLLEGGS